MPNIETYFPVIAAVLGGIGVWLLERLVQRNASRAKETSALKRIELERDSFIVSKAMEITDRMERDLLDAREEIRRLEDELTRCNEYIRLLDTQHAKDK